MGGVCRRGCDLRNCRRPHVCLANGTFETPISDSGAAVRGTVENALLARYYRLRGTRKSVRATPIVKRRLTSRGLRTTEQKEVAGPLPKTPASSTGP